MDAYMDAYMYVACGDGSMVDLVRNIGHVYILGSFVIRPKMLEEYIVARRCLFHCVLPGFPLVLGSPDNLSACRCTPIW